MKRTIFILINIFSASFAFAQGEVPAPVKAAFAAKHPDIVKVGWEKEHGSYEAEFKLKGVESSEVYDASGTLLETETQILVSLLPAPVHAYLAQNHKGQKVSEAAKITSANGQVTYEAEINHKDLIFTPEGKLLKNPEGDEDGDEDDDEDDDK